MLLVHHDLEHAGGNGAELCWKQQPADEQVSVRDENPIGCGGCAFTLLSRVSRRSWVSRCNIFRSSENLQAASTSSYREAHMEAHTSLNSFAFERYGSGKDAVKYIRKPLIRCF